MIGNSECGGFRPSEYFHALVDFERDPLPPATPASELREALGVRHRFLLQSRGVGSAQSPDSGPPSGGDCADGVRPRYWIQAPSLSLSQLEPLELV